MRQKSKLILISLVLSIMLASVVLFTACNKNKGAATQLDEYGSLIPKDVLQDSKISEKQKVNPEVSVDSNKMQTENPEITTSKAFGYLLKSIYNTSEKELEKIGKVGNRIYNQEIVTNLDVKDATSDYKIKTSLRIHLDLDPSISHEDKNKIAYEVAKVEGEEETLQFGLYYIDGHLLYKQYVGSASDLKPLHISDAQIQKIYSVIYKYHLDEQIREIIKGILKTDLALKMDGNNIKLIEFIGPVLFPIIFNQDVEVQKVSKGTKYTMTFNAEKMYKALTPVITALPGVLEKFVNNSAIGNLESFIGAIVDKVSGGKLGYADLQKYDVKNFTRNIEFTIDNNGTQYANGVGKLIDFKYNGRTPKITASSKEKQEVEVKQWTCEFKNENPLSELEVEGSLDDFIKYPPVIKDAITHLEENDKAGNEFRLGKIHLKLHLTAKTDQKRKIELNKLLGITSDDLLEFNEGIKKSNIQFYNLIGLSSDNNEINSDTVRNAYNNKLDSLEAELAKGSALSISKREDLQKEIKTLKESYVKYKSADTIKFILESLNEREFNMEAGEHGFKLDIRTDIKLNSKINESTAAIELQDSNNAPLIGIYLVPGKSGDSSDILLNLAGIGLPKILLASINLKELVYAPIVSNGRQILSEMSKKGLVGTIMQLVNKKKEGKKLDSSIVPPHDSHNPPLQSYAPLSLGNDTQSDNIFGVLTNIVKNEGTKKNDNGVYNIQIKSNDMLSLLGAVENLLKGKVNEQPKLKMVLKIGRRLIENGIEQVIVNFGFSNIKGEGTDAYANIGLKAGIHVDFKKSDENTHGEAHTSVDLGIDKLSLFFEPGTNYKTIIDTVIKDRNDGKYTDIVEIKQVALQTSIQMVLRTGSSDDAELIKFLKKLDPNGLGKKLKEAERNFFKNDPNKTFTLGLKAEEGFNFAVKLDIELYVNIKSLSSMGIIQSKISKINSLSELKKLFEDKLELSKLVQSFHGRIVLSKQDDLSKVLNDNDWKKVPEWDEFATVSYDSDTLSDTNSEGNLFVNFKDDTIPDISVQLDLIEVIAKKLDKGFSSSENITLNEDDEKNLFIFAKKSDGTNKTGKEKKSEKEKIDALNFALGLAGGVDFTSKSFVLRFANTAIQTIINEFLPHNNLSAADYPKMNLSFGMNYGDSGVGIRARMDQIRLNGNIVAEKGSLILLAINNLKLSLKNDYQGNLVSDTEKSEYNSLDSLKSVFDKDKIVKEFNEQIGKYVSIDTEFEILFKVGSDGVGYIQNFEGLIQTLNETVEEALNSNQWSPQDKSKLELLKGLSAAFKVTGGGEQIKIIIGLAGRVNISSLLKGVDLLSKAKDYKNEDGTNINPVKASEQKVKAIKYIIKALDLNINLRTYMTAERPENDPDLIVNLYIDGTAENIDLRIKSNRPSNEFNESRVSIKLKELNQNETLTRLFFMPKAKEIVEELAIANGEPTATLSLENYMKKIVDNVKELFNTSKDSMSILGLLSNISMTRHGIGVSLSKEILNTVLSAIGIKNPNLPDHIAIGANISLFPKGGLLGFTANVNVKDHDNELLNFAVGINRLNAGLEVSDKLDTDEKKKASIEKLSAKSLLAENFDNILYHGEKTSGSVEYVSIKEIQNFRFATNIALYADAIGSDALLSILHNYGLADTSEMDAQLSLTQGEGLLIGVGVDIPLKEIYQALEEVITKSDYTLDELLKPEVKENLKKELINKIIDIVIKNVAIKLEIKKVSNNASSENLLSVYYAGESKGNFIFVESTILSLPKGGIKFDKAPQKMASVIKELIKVKPKNQSEGGTQTINNSNKLNVFSDLINTLLGLNGKGVVDNRNPKTVAIDIVSGELSAKIQVAFIQKVLSVVGVNIKNIDLNRFANAIGVTAKYDVVKRDTVLSANVTLTGLKKAANGEDWEFVDAAKAKLQVSDIRFELQNVLKPLMAVPSDVTVIEIDKPDKEQYITISTGLEFGIEGVPGNINWNPAINLLGHIIKKIEYLDSTLGKDKVNESVELIKKFLVKQNKLFDNSADSEYRIEVSVRINIQDIFKYFSKLEAAYANVGSEPNQYKDKTEAKLRTNFELSYLAISLDIKKKVNNDFKRMLGVLYDSRMVIKDNANGILDTGNGGHGALVLRGTDAAIADDPNSDMNFISGKDLYLDMTNLGVDVTKIVNTQIRKANIKKIAEHKTTIEIENPIIGHNVNSNTGNLNQSSKKETVERIMDVLNYIGKIKIQDSNGIGLNIATVAMKTETVLLELAKEISKIAFIKDAVEEWKKEDNSGHSAMPTSTLSYEGNLKTLKAGLKIKVANVDNDNSLTVKASVSGLQLGVDTNVTEIYNNEPEFIKNLAPAGSLYFDVSTSINMYIQSPEYEFYQRFRVDTESKFAALNGILAKIKMEAGFDGSSADKIKHVVIGVQAKVNLGDLFEDRQPKDYKSEILLDISVAGYSQSIKVYTNLNDICVDLSAFNMPKIKIPNIDLLSVVKSFIVRAVDKARIEEQKKLQEALEDKTVEQSINESVSDNKSKIAKVFGMLALIDNFEAVKEGENGSLYTGNKIHLKGNAFNKIFESLLQIGQGFDEFDDINIHISEKKIQKGKGIILGGVAIVFDKKLPQTDDYAGGNFRMSAVIGKVGSLYADKDPIQTKIFLYESDSAQGNTSLISNINEYINYKDLALKVRAEASLEFESVGNPFLGLDGIMAILFNMLSGNGKYNGDSINSLDSSEYSQEFKKKLITIEKIKQGDISNKTGIYSKTEDNGQARFSGYLNIDLPLADLFSKDTPEDSKLKVQIKMVENTISGQDNTLINLIYSQEKKHALLDMPLLGISGFKLENIDLLQLLKKNLKYKQFVESMADMDESIQPMSLDNSRDSDEPTIEIDVCQDGLRFGINYKLVEKAISLIAQKLKEKVDDPSITGPEKDKLKSKYDLFKQLKTSIPHLSKIELQYKRPNNQATTATAQEAGSARIELAVSEGIGSENDRMTMTLVAYLNKNNSGYSVISSCDSTISEQYDNFFNGVDKIVEPEDSVLNNYSELEFDKIMSMISGGSILNNFPLKKLDFNAEFEATLKLDKDAGKEGPIKTFIELIDKVLLDKETSKSTINISDSGVEKKFNVMFDGIVDLTSPEAFRQKTKIKVEIKLKDTTLLMIGYDASTNLTYIDLENLGLVKVKLAGINLLSLIGPKMFSDNGKFVSTYALGNSNEPDQSWNKPRLEVDFRMTKADEKGLETKAVFKISDAFIKKLVEILVSKKVNDLAMANYKAYNTEKWQTIQKQIDNLNNLKNTINKFEFNDLMLSVKFNSKPGNNQSSLESFRFNINLDKKIVCGRIYKDDKEHSDEVLDENQEKSFFRLELKKLQMNKFGTSVISYGTDEDYAGLTLGDLSSLMAGNKSVLKPLVFNVIQLITGVNTSHFLNVGIYNNSRYESDKNIRNIDLKLKRSNQSVAPQGPVKKGKSTLNSPIYASITGKNNGSGGDTTIDAYLGLDNIIVHVGNLPGAEGLASTLLNTIKSWKMGIGPILKDKIGGLFEVTNSSGGSGASTEDEPIIQDDLSDPNYQLYTYKKGHGINKLLAIDAEGNYVTKGTFRKETWTKFIPISQLVSIRMDGGFNEYQYLYTWDKNSSYQKDGPWIKGDVVLTPENIGQYSRLYDANTAYINVVCRMNSPKQIDKLIVVLRKKKLDKDNLLPKNKDGKVNVKAILDSVDINIQKDSCIEQLNGEKIGNEKDDVTLKVNLNKEIVAHLIKFANDMLFNMMGGPRTQTGRDNQYTVNSVIGFIYSTLTSVHGAAMTLSNTLEQLRGAFLNVVKAVLPLPNINNASDVKSAYVKVQLRNITSHQLLRAVQIRIDATNADSIEIIVNNDGFKIDRVNIAGDINLSSDKTSMIDDIYDPAAISRAFSKISDLPTSQKVKLDNKHNSFGAGVDNYDIEISWIQNREDPNATDALDPLYSTDEKSNNYISYVAYAANKPINMKGHKVQIKMNKNSVRKPKKVDGKFAGLYVLRNDKDEGADKWSEFDYSLFENILPGYKKIKIDTYIKSIKQIGIQMVDGENRDVEGPDTITVGAEIKKVYVFGDKKGSFSIDPSKIPNSINGFKDLTPKDMKYSIVYGNGIVKNVKVDLPFTVINDIDINKAEIIETLKNELKELTKYNTEDGKPVYNSPDKWNSLLIAKLQSDNVLQNKIKLINKTTGETLGYDDECQFGGSAFLPFKVKVEDLKVTYGAGGSITVPEVTKPSDKASRTILGLYVPPYKPVRIYLNNFTVNVEMQYKGKKVNLGSFSIGADENSPEYNENNVLTFDLYPPFDVSQYSSYSESATSQSTSSMNYSSSQGLSFRPVALSTPMSMGPVKRGIITKYKVEMDAVDKLMTIYNDDEVFKSQLYFDGSNETLSTAMRFNRNELVKKIIGGENKDNIYLLIYSITNIETLATTKIEGETNQQRKDFVKNTIFAGDAEAFAEFEASLDEQYVLSVKDISLKKYVKNDNIISFIGKDTNPDGGYIYVAPKNDYKSGKKIRVAFGEREITELDTNKINKINKAEIQINPPTKEQLAKYYRDLDSDWPNDSEHDDKIDAFFKGTFKDLRTGIVQEGVTPTKDNLVEWIVKFNGRDNTINTKEQLDNIFTIIGDGNNKFDSLTDIKFEFGAKPDSKLYINSPDNSDVFWFNAKTEIDKELSYTLKINFRPETGIYDGIINVTSEEGHLEKGLFTNTIKLGKGNIQFKESNLNFNDVFKTEVEYYMTNFEKKVYRDKLSTLEVKSGHSTVYYNRIVLMITKIGNNKLLELKNANGEPITEQDIINGNIAPDFIPNYNSNWRELQLLFGGCNPDNDFAMTTVSENDGTSGTPDIKVTYDNKVRFMSIGDNFKLKKTLLLPSAYKNRVANIDIFNDKLVISGGIKKGVIRTSVVLVESLSETKSLEIQYSNNNLEIELIAPNNNKYANETGLYITFEWNILNEDRDSLGNLKISKEYKPSAISIKYKENDTVYASLDPDSFTYELSQKHNKTVQSQYNINDWKNLELKVVPFYLACKILDSNMKLAYKSKQPIYSAAITENKFVDIVPIIEFKQDDNWYSNFAEYNGNVGDKISKDNIRGRYEIKIHNEYMIQLSTEESIEEFKKNFEVLTEIPSELTVTVLPRAVDLYYKNYSNVYSGDTIKLSDLFGITNFEGTQDYTKDFINKNFKNIKLDVDGIEVDLSDDKNYQIDNHGNYYINSLRIPNLGAGEHKIMVKPSSSYNSYAVKIPVSNSYVSISKKPIKLKIGKKLKYYKQDIDEETIPFTTTEMSGDKEGIVSWLDYSEKQEGVLQKDLVAVLGLSFTWVEDVGMQDILVKDIASDNYLISIDDTNKNPGIMEIRKTPIRLQMYTMKKIKGHSDPIIDPVDLIYTDPRLLKVEEGNPEFESLYNAGIIEVEIGSDVFKGQIVRVPGEKIGTYRYSKGNLSVDSSKYDLIFVDQKGKEIKDFKEDLAALLKIEKDKKVIAPSVVITLTTLTTIVAIAIIVFAIILRKKAKAIRIKNAQAKSESKVME